MHKEKLTNVNPPRITTEPKVRFENLGSADIVIGNNIKIDRFATQRKVLNYFFIYKTTGNDSTALVIKTFHIILLIKPNFDF